MAEIININRKKEKELEKLYKEQEEATKEFDEAFAQYEFAGNNGRITEEMVDRLTRAMVNVNDTTSKYSIAALGEDLSLNPEIEEYMKSPEFKFGWEDEEE